MTVAVMSESEGAISPKALQSGRIAKPKEKGGGEEGAESREGGKVGEEQRKKIQER